MAKLSSHESSCYCLSKRPNCFSGTCSGLGTWRPRCTEDASSGMRHVVPLPLLSLIAHVIVLLNGGASPMAPALSTTRASVPVPVLFPQLSLPAPSYRPITPSPCALDQQVIASCTCSIVLPCLMSIQSGLWLACTLPFRTAFCSLALTCTGLILALSHLHTLAQVA